MSRKHSIIRQTKPGDWGVRHILLLAAWLLILAACGEAASPALVPTPTLFEASITVPPPTLTLSPVTAPFPTPQRVASCAVDVLTYLFAAEFSPQGSSPELGRLVESREAYESAFGVSPDLPYDPEQPLTGINWNIQRQLAALGIQLAENGRAVVLPEFAQGVGIEEVIRRDSSEAAIFFAGVNDGQAPATALRAVVHASENGGYVVNLTDGAGNFYLLVEEGTGQTLGWPGDVGVETVTDVVRLASSGGGEVVPLKVNGCDWLLGVVGEDGRVAAALEMAPGMDAAALAWQINPNPPEAVATVPTATPEQEAADLPQSCFDQEVIQTTLDNYLVGHGQTYDQLAAEIQAEMVMRDLEDGFVRIDWDDDGEYEAISIHRFGRSIGVTTASIEHLPGMSEGDYVKCLLVANPRDGVIPMIVDGRIGGIWSPLTHLYVAEIATTPSDLGTETLYRDAMERLIESRAVLNIHILSRVDGLPFQEPNPLVDGHYRANYGWAPPYYEHLQLLLELSYVRRTTENNISLGSLDELRTMLDPFDVGFFGSQIIVESEQ